MGNEKEAIKPDYLRSYQNQRKIILNHYYRGWFKSLRITDNSASKIRPSLA
jgi:hypothetical protein